MSKRKPKDESSEKRVPFRTFRFPIPIGDLKEDLKDLQNSHPDFQGITSMSQAGAKVFKKGMQFFMGQLPLAGRIQRLIAIHPKMKGRDFMEALNLLVERGLQEFEAELALIERSPRTKQTIQGLLQKKLQTISAHEFAQECGITEWDIEQLLEGTLPEDLMIDVLCAIANGLGKTEEQLLEMWQRPVQHRHKTGNGV